MNQSDHAFAALQDEGAVPLARPLRVGIIGMGGFAGIHHATIHTLEQAGWCKLVCTCDPNPAAFVERMQGWDFPHRDVNVYDRYDAMLDASIDKLDLVTIPTPVPLHAQMHRACVERGIAAYLEKPPTLDIAELQEMLAVEGSAIRKTNIGFNYIIEEPRQTLKRRLMQGEFGRLRKVLLSGLWPRGRSYYRRANWAGRLLLDGKLVLDSCLGNALAHYVHNMLFWAGQKDLFDWSPVAQVRAELYRAHSIQGTDTLFVEAETSSGVELRIALTHACAGENRHWERVECDDASITYVTDKSYEIRHSNGKVETQSVPSVSLRENLIAYLGYLSGEGLNRPITQLADAQPFVELNDLAYLASGSITTVQDSDLDITQYRDGREEYVTIRGIDDACLSFLDGGLFPSQQRFAWAHVGGAATPSDLPHLCDVVNAMAKQVD